MDRGDVVEGLRGMLSDSLVRLPEREELCVRHSIALIEPQPVTEAGLREAGFEKHAIKEHVNWVLKVQPDLWITFYRGKWNLEPTDGGWYPLHIADMQQLHAVIAALGGDRNQ